MTGIRCVDGIRCVEGIRAVGVGQALIPDVLAQVFPLSMAGGAWIAPRANTLFEDAAGVTLATDAADPVGLIYDVKHGTPVLGAELRVNITTRRAGSGVANSATYNTSTGAGYFQRISSGDQTYLRAQLSAVGAWAKFTITNSGPDLVALRSPYSGSFVGNDVSSGQTQTFLAKAEPSYNYIDIIIGAASGSANVVIGSVKELPGYHSYQTTTTARGLLRLTPSKYVELDQVDDNYNTYFPQTITGTMLLGLKEGIIHAEISKTAGVWPWFTNPIYKPKDSLNKTNIVGMIVRNDAGVISAGELAVAKAYLVSQGAGSGFSTLTSMSNWFRARTDVTKLTLSDFVMTGVTNLAGFAQDASNLVTVTVGTALNTCPAVNFTNAFDNAKLNQASISAIITAIYAAGGINGTLGVLGLNNATPDAAALLLVADLRATRGWTINNSNGW